MSYHQNVFPRNTEISVRWILVQSGNHFYLIYQPSATCNPGQRWEILSVLVKLWANRSERGTVCHYIRFIYQLSYERHIPTLKCFHSQLRCSVASQYHGNNKMKDFLNQNFPLGCLCDFQKDTANLTVVFENIYRGIHFLKKL